MKWMDRERSFWVIGGDLRQRALARLLREDGHTVHIARLEGEGLEPEPLGPGLALAHCVILPLPVAVGESFVHTPLSAARLPLAQVLDCLRPGQLVCGGMISPAVAAEMTRRGLRWADYYAREECMVANAVPTAEENCRLRRRESRCSPAGTRGDRKPYLVSCPLLTPQTFLCADTSEMCSETRGAHRGVWCSKGTPLMEAELFAAERCRPAPDGRALLCAAVYAS